ncbi:alkaline shock response membrane anchor protein AmaP [Streptomyces triculaminicus]|uniref:alkaline shock response membrane anchor protein AmaP n=1 Tax=Streptomyces triculaminicus TaxID=2816232 RepID=UPI0037D2C2B8
MLRTANRILLGLAGVLLLALGAAVLAGALDLPRRWDVTLPAAWPFAGPDDVPLSAARRRGWGRHGWWWPTVIAALGVVVALSLGWLLAQARRHRLREVGVDSGDGETVVVRGHALQDALTAEAAALEGVDDAVITLTGRRTVPRARIGLTLAPHARPADALRRLDAEVLRHARTSAGLLRLPAEVRLRAVRHPARRVG